MKIMHRKAISSMDIGLCTAILSWRPLESFCKMHVLGACQKCRSQLMCRVLSPEVAHEAFPADDIRIQRDD